MPERLGLHLRKLESKVRKGGKKCREIIMGRPEFKTKLPFSSSINVAPSCPPPTQKM